MVMPRWLFFLPWHPRGFVSFGFSEIFASLGSLLGSLLVSVSPVAAVVVLGAVTTLNV